MVNRTYEPSLGNKSFASECLFNWRDVNSSVAQSRPTLCDPMECSTRQAFLSITNSRSLLRLMSIKSVMPSNHLILCHLLLFPPSVFPSIRVCMGGIHPPKFMFKFVSLIPQNVTFSRDRVLTDVIVKVRSLGWVLIHIEWCP